MTTSLTDPFMVRFIDSYVDDTDCGSDPSDAYDGEAKDFLYDGLGRLRERVDWEWDGSEWVWLAEVHYIYDGWRVIQERNSDNAPQVSYTRGIDLSGSLEGAGGIGGLLARSSGLSSGHWTTHAFYHADGNGNITCLVDTNQAVVASYRYDPYGNTISQSGTLADANVYRFSSKEFIPASFKDWPNAGMYYYGYRFYDLNLQRWLNRDPLGELGFEAARSTQALPTQLWRLLGTGELLQGANLYTFVRNAPLTYNDRNGLEIVGGPGPRNGDSCCKNGKKGALVEMYKENYGGNLRACLTAQWDLLRDTAGGGIAGGIGGGIIGGGIAGGGIAGPGGAIGVIIGGGLGQVVKPLLDCLSLTCALPERE